MAGDWLSSDTSDLWWLRNPGGTQSSIPLVLEGMKLGMQQKQQQQDNLLKMQELGLRQKESDVRIQGAMLGAQLKQAQLDDQATFQEAVSTLAQTKTPEEANALQDKFQFKTPAISSAWESVLTKNQLNQSFLNDKKDFTTRLTKLDPEGRASVMEYWDGKGLPNNQAFAELQLQSERLDATKQQEAITKGQQTKNMLSAYQQAEQDATTKALAADESGDTAAAEQFRSVAADNRKMIDRISAPVGAQMFAEPKVISITSPTTGKPLGDWIQTGPTTGRLERIPGTTAADAQLDKEVRQDMRNKIKRLQKKVDEFSDVEPKRWSAEQHKTWAELEDSQMSLGTMISQARNPTGDATETPAAAPQVQQVKTQADIDLRIQQANDAIKAGKDPNAVRAQLEAMGIKLQPLSGGNAPAQSPSTAPSEPKGTMDIDAKTQQFLDSPAYSDQQKIEFLSTMFNRLHPSETNLGKSLFERASDAAEEIDRKLKEKFAPENKNGSTNDARQVPFTKPPDTQILNDFWDSSLGQYLKSLNSGAPSSQR
jgi:hypothetical protein